MTPASRRRRLLLGATALLFGGVLVAFADDPLMGRNGWKAKLLGPAAVFYGVSGLLYPPSVPDPKPEGGAIAAVALMGSPAYRVGGAMLALGLAVGACWLFA